ncbi:MAG: mechanosensitive ion channel family protein [Verrucomicrobiae bacterium]|nr:mechanosensitive ion channel family protein [Verrucomicrobiae bacterium]
MAVTIDSWLVRIGGFRAGSMVLSTIVAAGFVLVLAYAAHVLARNFLLRLVTRVITRTKSEWDDALLEHRFFDHLARLAPAIVIYLLAPDALAYVPSIAAIVSKAAVVYMVFTSVLAVDSLLAAGQKVYLSLSVSKSMPITGFVQLIKIFVYGLGIVLTISVLIDRSPAGLLTGLGAMSAVTMLVFKDAILGFVAGIQLSANRMVAAGDWIEVPSQGIDGDVMEVGLTTVKIRNFDKTITTLPTYHLITGSFKNWRGMQESGGRRIKRALRIDMSSVKFCDPELLERFRHIDAIREFVAGKEKEISEHNLRTKAGEESSVNGRRMTNLGTFRAYVEAYLRNHPQISKDLTFLVRQLAPTESGIPLEIYVFCKDQRWVAYEGIMADIFDHLLAALPAFDLRVFQSPTGNDMRVGFDRNTSPS